MPPLQVDSFAAEGLLTARHCTAMLHAMARQQQPVGGDREDSPGDGAIAAVAAERIAEFARVVRERRLDGDAAVVRALFGAWCRCGEYSLGVSELERAAAHGVLSMADARRLLMKPLVGLARQGGAVGAWQLFRPLQASACVDVGHYNVMLGALDDDADDVDDADDLGCPDQAAACATTVVVVAERGGSGPPDERGLLAAMGRAGVAPDTVTFNMRLQRKLRGCSDVGSRGVGGRKGNGGFVRGRGSEDAADWAAATVADMRAAAVPPNKATYLLLHRAYLLSRPEPAAAAA